MTRLYSPIDYASMALFTAVVAISVSVSTGRYDSAVPLPPESQEGEHEGLRLAGLATGIALTASITGGLALLALNASGVEIWANDLGAWIFALPVATALLAVNQCLIQYANRRREYLRLSTVSPISKAVTASLQIALGNAGAGRSGLLIPAVLSPVIGATLLIRILREGIRTSSFTTSDLSPARLWRTAAAFRDFPLVATWIALINALNTTVQILIIASLFGSEEVGQYALAMALLSIPVAAIAGSVSSVYYREMASRVGDPDSALRLTKKTIGVMSLAATLVAVVVGVTAVPLFPIIFGEQWQEAGYFAVALLPWVWVRLIGIPLSAALAATRRQAWQLIWQLALLAAFCASYFIGDQLGASALECTWIASGTAVPLYLALIPMVKKAIGAHAAAASRVSHRSVEDA